MDEEIWKVWKDTRYNPRGYLWEASTLGRIRINGKIVEPIVSTINQYLYVGHYSVHRIVAETFLPNPNNYRDVDHIDGNKYNNRVDNLRWCTHKDNMNNPNTINSFKNRSEHTLQLYSERTKGRKAIHKDNVMKKVKVEELESYLNDGWSLGSIYTPFKGHHHKK